MKCKDFEKMVILDMIEPLDDSKKKVLEKHIQVCQVCAHDRHRLEKFQDLYQDSLGEIPVPDWDRAWLRIRENVSPSPQKRNSFVGRYRWAMASGFAVVIFVFGIAVGKWFIQSPAVQMKISNQHMVSFNLREHFEEIKPILMDYKNAKVSNQNQLNLSSSLVMEKDFVSQLLVKNRMLRRKVSEKDNVYLSRLLEELEIILTEIANITQDDPEYVMFVKDLIEQKGILFKMKFLNSESERSMRI